MNAKFRNIFLIIGVLAIIVMLFTFDMSYTELWNNLRHAGWWFIAVILIWIPIYLLNAWSWIVIINNGEKAKVSFWKVCKYTISGYALNYVTPVGILGGEPYRIMELSNYVGTARATSSVILYAMMHIFSHFIFWAFSIPLFCIFYYQRIDIPMTIFLLVTTAFCVLGIYFFMKGYKNGLAMKTIRLFTHVPFVKKRALHFMETKYETVERIDTQIAELHKQRKPTFYWSLFLEFLSRVVGCLEIWFILMILTDSVSFWDCVLIQAFTSLFANLFFFMPMELGAREGGFALAVGGLAMSGAFGVLAGLLTRVRELVWIVVGIGLMKIGNKKK